jgi:hypothetical protein
LLKIQLLSQAQNRGGCNVVFSVVQRVGATKNHGRLVVGRGSMKNDGRAIGFKSHPGCCPGSDAKNAVRGGVRTIVASRGWLNAFVCGFRLAWLSPFRLSSIV